MNPRAPAVPDGRSRVIARAVRDPAFRQQLLADPRAAIEQETGIKMPAEVEIQVVEETATKICLVLPMPQERELSDAELSALAGGWGWWYDGHYFTRVPASGSTPTSAPIDPNALPPPTPNLTPSSCTLKDQIEPVSAEAAMQAVVQLAPVTFVYKTEPTVRHVGFIAEDMPDLVAAPDRKSVSAMDLVAVLTKAVQEQQATISRLCARVAKLERQRRV